MSGVLVVPASSSCAVGSLPHVQLQLGQQLNGPRGGICQKAVCVGSVQVSTQQITRCWSLQ
jgi:hypothetical protein